MKELIELQNKVNAIMVNKEIPLQVRKKVAKSFNNCLDEIIDHLSIKTYNYLLIQEVKKRKK